MGALEELGSDASGGVAVAGKRSADWAEGAVADAGGATCFDGGAACSAGGGCVADAGGGR